MGCVLSKTKTERNRRLRLVLDDQERERSDLASRLHDELAQSLAGVALELSALERRASEADAPRLAGLRGEIESALVACTSLAVGLRPPVLDHIGLAPAVETIAHRAGAELVRVGPQAAARELDPVLATEIYRIVEEALRAVGPGCNLVMSLDVWARVLSLSVRPLRGDPHIGELGRLHARVELMGGTVTAGSLVLAVRIPLRVAGAAPPTAVL
jgi:hypothetical protein